MNFETALRACLSKYVTSSGQASRLALRWFVFSDTTGVEALIRLQQSCTIKNMHAFSCQPMHKYGPNPHEVSS